MKNKPLLVTTLSTLCAATLIVGCKKADRTDEPQPVDTNTIATTTQQNIKDVATNAWQKTKEAATNVVDSIKESVHAGLDYAYDKKDAFTTKASADLDALDQNIKDLEAKAATGTESVKADAQAKIQELRDKRPALQQKLNDVKNATAANWDDAKTAFKQSYDDMKTGVKNAWQWLNDKLGA